MLTPLHVAIRFILELAAVVAAAVVGASIGSPPFGIVGAVVLAGAFVTAWGLFLAPRARFPQPAMVRLVVGTIVMEVPATALAVIGPMAAGVILAVAIVVNAVAIAAAGATDADEVFSR